MTNTNNIVGVFEDHTAADNAVKELTKAGIPLKHLSIVGKGYHTEESVVGFYNVGDRMKFWGSRGAFWGGLWGLFFGGLFITLPVMGPVVVLGYIAAPLIAALEGAITVGGLSAVGAAMASVGIPKDSVVQYETAIAADGFLVMATGDRAELERAKSILGTAGARQIDNHGSAVTVEHDALVS